MYLIVNLNPALDAIYTIDDFQLGKIHRTSNVYKQAGGKGINVARACNVLKGKSIVTGLLGGNIGELILEDLDKSNINYKFNKTNQESRNCLIIVDPKNETHTVINEGGPAFNDCELDNFISDFKIMIANFNYLVISGSVPDSITRDIYAELIEIAKKNKVKSIVDASKLALKGAIKAKPFLIKPNVFELAEAFGHKELVQITDSGDFKPLIALCKSILNEGVENILISIGDKGALFINKNVAFRAIAPKVNVINPIASGDSMAAALALELDKENSIEEAVISGVAAGSANATIGGLKFTYELYEELRKLVKIEYIDKEPC